MSTDNSKVISASADSLSINSFELPSEIKTRFDESLSVPGLNAERLVQDLHAEIFTSRQMTHGFECCADGALVCKRPNAAQANTCAALNEVAHLFVC